MLERLGEMRVELDALSASLDGSPDSSAPEDALPAVAVPAPGAVQPVAAVPEPDGAPSSAEPPEPPAAPGARPASRPLAGLDDAGARLIALNLALSDTPRDEAARQLRDQVPDPERLVDEVYASVDR